MKNVLLPIAFMLGTFLPNTFTADQEEAPLKQEASTSTVQITAKDSDEESAQENECEICLMEMEATDVLRFLPCTHKFHQLCIDTWLNFGNARCPKCRCNAFTGEPQGDTTPGSAAERVAFRHMLETVCHRIYIQRQDIPDLHHPSLDDQTHALIVPRRIRRSQDASKELTK